MIGSSDGKQYASELDLVLDRPVQNEKNSYHNENSTELNIDRDHHVPLVASALMDPEGKMYGMAVDHRVPPNPEFDQFLHLHEASELPHMQNLVDAGMSNQEAYHEAHDRIATPTETAAVRGYAARNGKDPDQYLDQYKQYWRDAAAIAREPTDRPRHPDAHTTRFGLDESEVGYKDK